MSTDVAFWSGGSLPPRELYDAASDGVGDPFVADDLLIDFRDSVLTTWPHLDYAIEPDFDEDDAERYLLFTLSVGDVDLLPQIVQRAVRSFGLSGYDPQTGATLGQ